MSKSKYGPLKRLTYWFLVLGRDKYSKSRSERLQKEQVFTEIPIDIKFKKFILLDTKVVALKAP